jgi:formate C-acetyltransferase
MHEHFGRNTGASPDGRKAGFPLGDGSGPCQGREKNGPTASVLSSTKWSHKELIGGVAVNMKFSKKTMNAQSKNTMVSLIKTYLERGGFEMQINVVDKETLIKAKANPENYSDLVVRIGGYSDYFTKIPEKMQDEVILRTEHEI